MSEHSAWDPENVCSKQTCTIPIFQFETKKTRNHSECELNMKKNIKIACEFCDFFLFYQLKTMNMGLTVNNMLKLIMCIFSKCNNSMKIRPVTGTG